MGRVVLNLPDGDHDRIVGVLREACAIHLVASRGPTARLRTVWADVREQLVRNATRNPTPEQELTEKPVVAVCSAMEPVIDIIDVDNGGPFVVTIGPFDLLQAKIRAEKISGENSDIELVAEVRVGP